MGEPESCDTDLDLELSDNPTFPWTDITYLLHKNQIDWGYYVTSGDQPDCVPDTDVACQGVPQAYNLAGPWNPLPRFDTVNDDNELDHLHPATDFYGAVQNGTLPAVSWVVPSADVSEHAPGTVSAGQSYVTDLINKVMQDGKK